jgi:putative phosphoribosyl transferase
MATERESAPGGGEAGERRVWIPIDGGELSGSLILPAGADAIVLFAHGAGSSRFSPRNQYVARVIRDAGIGTLLFDLLMESEAADRANVFDIGLLASRLIQATSWLLENPQTGGLRVGYFGASTGAAAALTAAARIPDTIAAVVSRGGRPDLAYRDLGRVRAPTLLIVGGADEEVLELNRTALEEISADIKKELVVVPGATHLFEEPGALEEVANFATDWFSRYLANGTEAIGRAA